MKWRVEGCRTVTTTMGGVIDKTTESVRDDDEADFFGVYAILPSGMSSHVCDFATRAEAEAYGRSGNEEMYREVREFIAKLQGEIEDWKKRAEKNPPLETQLANAEARLSGAIMDVIRMRDLLSTYVRKGREFSDEATTIIGEVSHRAGWEVPKDWAVSE